MNKIIITTADLENLRIMSRGKKAASSMMRYLDGLFKQDSRTVVDVTKESIIRRNPTVKDTAEYYKKLLIENQTSAEQKFKMLLKSRGIDYEFQKIFYCGTGFVIADFYLPEYKLVFEIDGGYHNKAIQKVKDARRTSMLIGTTEVIKVSRIENKDVLKTDSCIEFICKEINLLK